MGRVKIYLACFLGMAFILGAGLGGCGEESAKAKPEASDKATGNSARALAKKEALPAVSRSRYATTALLEDVLGEGSAATSSVAGKGQKVGGLRIDLEYGWKTYWRSPGDSGVPPSFDWSQSGNVKKVEVKWPAPKRYVNEAGQSIGYKKHVLLPLVITPKDPSRPVKLRLKMFYGVCSDICVPVQAKMGIAVPVKGNNGNPDLERAVRHLPQDGPGKGFAVRFAKIIKQANGKNVMRIAVHFPEGSSQKDVFVERLDGEYIAPTRKLAPKGEGGTHLFEIALDEDMNVQELGSKKLKVTLASDRGAAEMVVSPTL